MLVDSIIQALQLFALGMGTVFSLLVALIICVRGLSLFCMKFLDKEAVVQPLSAAINAPLNDGDAEIAAAAIAVAKYKASQKS